MTRRFLPTLAFALSTVFFGVGTSIVVRLGAATEYEQIAALRSELVHLKRERTETALAPSGRGTGATAATSMDESSRAALIADITRQLKREMGLLPLSLLRERRSSFVELYSYDTAGDRTYGTAGYLGNGYFMTVKHGVVALGENAASRPMTAIKLIYAGRAIAARLIDAGDAARAVDPGDWAILKVDEAVDLPPLDVDLGYGFEFAEPIFRLGNDYSRGIILSTGYVGQRTPNNLVTCLTDGHPGVSGGGVLNAEGHLVGIPIGRIEGDYRFSFILPLRADMFRKVEFSN